MYLFCRCEMNFNARVNAHLVLYRLLLAIIMSQNVNKQSVGYPRNQTFPLGPKIREKRSGDSLPCVLDLVLECQLGDIKRLENECCKLRCANASRHCFAFALIEEVKRYNYIIIIDCNC